MRSIHSFAIATLCVALLAVGLSARIACGADPWLVVDGAEGPGHGKNVVLIAADDEYRSEEMLPQLAKILARRHGFHCTVLFAIDPKDGTINPDIKDNIPGLEALGSADLLVIFTRMRNLPDEQMQQIVDYVESGRPIIGVRTATHAFEIPTDRKFARYSWNSELPDWKGGFGRRVLGETWIKHHGDHGKESTRGMIAPGQAEQPILRGIKDGDIWGPTDVYFARLPMLEHCQALVLGQVLNGMHADDSPVAGKKNDPMLPIAWTNAYTGAAGKTARVFCSTIGAAPDFESEGVRRLLVNASYWAVGLEDKIPAHNNVDLVGEFHPHPFAFHGFTRGVKPADLAGD